MNKNSTYKHWLMYRLITLSVLSLLLIAEVVGWGSGFKALKDVLPFFTGDAVEEPVETPEVLTIETQDTFQVEEEDFFVEAGEDSTEMMSIPSGSFIINMGVQPQTVNNALKPYGLVWHLLHDHEVPVLWCINPDKGKDGIDFTHNGIAYRGGPFIILAQYRTAAVNALIANWQAQGVVGNTTTSDFTAPVNRKLSYSMNWTLNSDNGSIAKAYLDRAGIPSSAYNWTLPQNLDCCNDVFLMPHSEPTWSSHNRLFTWNASPGDGGCAGALWAGCKAGSEVENIVNPANPSQRMNFLMSPPASPSGNPAVPADNHNDGTLPYSYGFPAHPVMQFLGTMDGAQENGAEQIYLPTVGWRPTTFVGIWDPDHPQVPSLSPGLAAKLAFGPAFGDNARGHVMYQTAHRLDKDNKAENIAAQRAFFNFSFVAAGQKAIRVSSDIPEVIVGGTTQSLTASASGGSGNYYYHWTSTCPGTFSNPYSSNTSFTAAEVVEDTECFIKVTVTDDCGSRVGFANVRILFQARPAPPVAVDDYEETQPGTPVTVNALANDSDLNGDPLTLTAMMQSEDCAFCHVPFDGCTPPTSGYDAIVNVTGSQTWGSLLSGFSSSNFNNKVKITGTGILTVTNGDLKLANSNALLVIDGPELQVNNGNFYLESGARFILSNGILRTSGNLQQQNNSFVCITESEVEIGDEQANGTFNSTGNFSTSANFQNSGGKRFLRNVNLNVTQNYQLESDSGGEDVWVNVCAEIGDQGPNHASTGSVDGQDSGNFQISRSMKIFYSEIVIIENAQNSSSATLWVCDVAFRTLNGNFQNSGHMEGSDLSIWVDNSHSISSSGNNWTATLVNRRGSISGVPNPPANATLEAISAVFDQSCSIQLPNLPSDAMVCYTKNGYFVGSSDGQVTFTPNYDFVGTEQINYVVCDNTPLADGGPMCDTATIYITVDWIDENGCFPDQYWGKFAEGYATAVLNQNSIGNPAQAIGEPLLVNSSNSYYAKIDNNSDYLVLDLGYDVPVGDTIFIYFGSDDGSAATLVVSGTLNSINYSSGSGFYDQKSYSTTTDLDANPANQDTVAYVPATGPVRRLRFRRAPDAGKPGVNGVRYESWRCLSAVPVANDDVVTICEDHSTEINVLANDHDPQDLPLTASLISLPSHGTINLLSSGVFKYQPDVDYSGSDGFTYQVCNDDDICVQATVSITIFADGCPDGQTTQFGDRDETVADHFPSNTYTNNTGTQSWATPWTEEGDDGTPGSGKIKVSGGVVECAVDGSYAIYRQADLSNVIAAVFSFNVVGHNLNGDDVYVVEVSNDGGVNYLPLKYFHAGSPGNSSESFDLQQIFVSLNSNVIIRFRREAGSGGEKFKFDNVLIKYTKAGCFGSCQTIPTFPPDAVNDAATTFINTPVEIPVQENDIDPSELGIITYLGYSNPPDNGNIELIGNEIRYVPNPGFSGVDHFNYKICNIYGCDSALVSVTVLCADPADGMAIQGMVFNDVNQNGSITGSHQGQDNAKVRLYKDLNLNGQIDPADKLVDSVWTDNWGNYVFNLGNGASSSSSSQMHYPVSATGSINNDFPITNATGAPDNKFVKLGKGKYVILEFPITIPFGSNISVHLASDKKKGKAIISGSGDGSTFSNPAVWSTPYSSDPGNPPPASAIKVFSYQVAAAGGIKYLKIARDAENIYVDAASWKQTTITTGGSTTVSLSRSISASSDDAEEEGQEGVNLGPGGMSLTSSDLELTQDFQSPSNGTQKIGLRFRTMDIPPGSIITSAVLKFIAKSPNSPNTNNGPASLTIQGEAIDHAPTFNTVKYNISDRALTSTSVDWQPTSWTSNLTYTSPDLKDIVQEIVNRPGWTDGNSMAFFITGTGSRSAVSYNGSTSNAPVLEITFVTPGEGAAGYYILQVDTSSLPPNSVLTTAPTNAAVVINDGDVDCANNFGFIDHLPPIANPDTAYVDAGTTAIIDLIANDSDPEGTPLTATILTNPVNGTVLYNGNGTIKYTPHPGFIGWETFFYYVCDQGTPTLCDTSTVTVIVNPYVNQAPIAQNDYDTTVVNYEVETDVLANDFDPQFENLTVSLSPGMLQPANGTIEVLGNGEIEYTPNPGFTGDDVYQYIVCDNGAPVLCDTATVFIHVRNQPPIAVNDLAETGLDLPVSIQVLANDHEPDGHDIILLSAGLLPSATGGGTKKGGTVAVHNNGTPNNPADDFIQYVPAPGFTGLDTFYYLIRDTGTPHGYDEAMVRVNVKQVVDLELDKSVLPGIYSVGQDVTFRLTLVNQGPTPATGILVIDKLTSSYAYVSDSGNGNFDPVTGIWHVPSLHVGETATMDITATLLDFLALKNVSEVVACGQVDIDSTPNNDDGDQSEDDEDNAIPFITEICGNGLDDDGDGLADCEDPECLAIMAPILVDDQYSTCPGLPFSERVTYNDGNLQSPLFSIASPPQNGMVTMDATGKFFYLPLNMDCQVDTFVYQVCNQTTGCCSQAKVIMNIGDNTPPVLINVPADVVIDCADAVPPAGSVMAFDQCPGVYVDFNQTSGLTGEGTCKTYDITRTWTATDLCGNSVSKSQIITVLDETAPEIFQVYTLANGSRVAAGVSERTFHHWKYVKFPVTFSQPPVVFAQVASNEDVAAVSVKLRNISTQGFEMRLREEENADGVHAGEQVAWAAIEMGKQGAGFVHEAGTWDGITDQLQTRNFTQTFTGPPILLSTVQTAVEMDPVTVRHQSVTANAAQLFLQEETSKDSETAHQPEKLGFLAIQPGSLLTDQDGRRFGEAGTVNLTGAWATVSLMEKYTKPVVVIGGPTKNNSAPVTVRVRNVTDHSFEVRLQRWDYLGGNPGTEQAAWMVVEGSVPGNGSFYCEGGHDHLKPGINVFSLDNCDNQVSFASEKSAALSSTGLVTSHTWKAFDNCGNTNLVNRFDTCVVAAVQVKALFYGPLINNFGSDLMRDDLRVKKYVPVFEPFSNLSAFPHVNNTVPNYVTICHDPGGPGQVTMSIPQSELQAHLDNGAEVGTCQTIPIGTAELPATAQNADYRTIANGTWDSPSTWAGGNVPPAGNMVNQTVSIEHSVILPTGDLLLKNNSRIWITNGGLTLGTGDIRLQASTLVAANSTIEVTVGDIATWTGTCRVEMKNCQVKVGKDFKQESGSRRLESVCIEVGNDLVCGYDGVTDTLYGVTAKVGGMVINYNKGRMHLSNSRFWLTNGNFENTENSTVTGDGIIIWLEDGDVLNNGTWAATIEQFCIAGKATNMGNVLPALQNCKDISNYFTSESCSHADETTTVTYNNEEITVEKIAGLGSIHPAMLLTEGGNAVVDWVLVELRDPADDKNILGYATAILQRDGEIVSEDGDPVMMFPGLVEGDYYVAVRHRNHLGLMTDTPLYLSSDDVPLVDFTDPALPVRGGGVAGRVFNGRRSLWAGDLNGDGKTIYQGPYNDVFHLFSRVLSDPANHQNLANFIVNGYEIQDMNLDGKVIYQGPNNDRATLLYHTVLSHSSNALLLANFIVTEKLP